jgi:hypothetical protein
MFVPVCATAEINCSRLYLYSSVQNLLTRWITLARAMILWLLKYCAENVSNVIVMPPDVSVTEDSALARAQDLLHVSCGDLGAEQIRDFRVIISTHKCTCNCGSSYFREFPPYWAPDCTAGMMAWPHSSGNRSASVSLTCSSAETPYRKQSVRRIREI